jgi:serine phosphatase RsbU (regulator of sigma subunit)
MALDAIPLPLAPRAPSPDDRTGHAAAVILADAAALGGPAAGTLRRLRRAAPDLPIVLVGEAAESAPWVVADSWLDPADLPEPIRRVLGLDDPDDSPSPVERQFRALHDRHERLLAEMRMAEQVQKSMLPRSLPRVPGVRFGASLRPCQHMAGDFYQAFRLDRDRVGFYVGDVMGHGPAAALLSVFAMQVIRTKLIEGDRYEILAPSQTMAHLNRDLIDADFPGHPFITMFYAVLDIPRRHLRYCAAGHPPALRLRPGAPPVELGGGGPLLGLIEAEFTTHEVELRPGDRLALYSDGVEVTRWGDAHPPGLPGLIARLSNRGADDLQPLVDSAMSDALLDEWRPDDLTLLVAEIDS